VTIRKTINLVIGPTDKAVGRYTSSQDTKDAVLNAVNPSKVGLRVSRLTKARNNAIRIEACEADLDRLRASPGLKEAGLEVKKNVMLNPRVIIYGVPSVLLSDVIRSQLAEQDVDGEGIDDIRVVYRYPARQAKSYSSCVVEKRPETRSRFISAERVFLGWSACKMADHVKVLQCFKCLSFCHLAANCTKTVHCGHCSEDHETKQCSHRDKPPHCFNCSLAKETYQSHSAFDVNKCNVLKHRITAKIHRINYG
ncbi:putative 50 kda protein in type i retrotransposable element r1dm, partial [Lasius niger]